MDKYGDLYSLIENDKEAKKFYEAMPDYVREAISERANNITSYHVLHNYASNLLKGDG